MPRPGSAFHRPDWLPATITAPTSETEARKDSPVTMLTELQQTLELTSHAMVRDPKLLVRVMSMYSNGLEDFFDHQPSFHGARRHQQPGGHPRAFGDALYSIGPGNIPSPSPLPALPKATSNSNRNIPTSIPSSTQMFFSDSIESRKPTIKEDPPRWRGTELLPPIQLEIGISAKGTVEAVRWTGHSRNESLFSTFHQEVIQFIKRLQFTP